MIFGCIVGAYILDAVFFKTDWHYIFFLFIGLFVGLSLVIVIETYWKPRCPECNEAGFKIFQEERNGPMLHECNSCGVKYKGYKKSKP